LKHYIMDLKCHLRKGLLALGLALLASVLLVAMAVAHSSVVKSEPASGAVLNQSPQRVVAWFSQELETRLSTIQVFDAEGRQVDNGDGSVDLDDPDHASMLVSLPPSLPAGVYTVRWTVVSTVDSDLTEGEFAFGVGAGTVVPEPGSTPSGVSSVWLIGGSIASLGVLLLAVLGFAGRRQMALD
jgi:methionine-rich copper-binding protein CopC